MKQILIDTDPGDDDASAILWCLASGELDVQALTVTHGNVELEKCVLNALKVVEAAGRPDIPVYRGAAKPLVRPVRYAHWIHGADGLGDADIPLPKIQSTDGYAPVEIARRAMNSQEPLTILALGPLTNIALAISLEPRLKERVKEIILMGGAVQVPGNETPRASFNIAVDPEAAHIVYQSGIPIVQVGLDVCDQVTQTVEDLNAIEAAHTPVTDWLVRVLEFRRSRAKKEVFDENGKLIKVIQASDQVSGRGHGIGLNDLTTAGYVIFPDWFQSVHVNLDVEIQGSLTFAETVADFNGLWGKEPNALLPLHVDGEALVKRWVSDMRKYEVKDYFHIGVSK